MKLSRIEQETIIVWNNAEDTATVYTCDTKLQRKLDNLSPLVQMIKSDEYSKTYNLSKKLIQVRKPISRSDEFNKNLSTVGTRALKKSMRLEKMENRVLAIHSALLAFIQEHGRRPDKCVLAFLYKNFKNLI